MEISQVLHKNNFHFTHSLGQNFIFDKNLLEAIVNDADITNIDTVVEIGAGAGTLTLEIAKQAKRVVAFEIDKKLEPVLKEVFEGIDNVETKFMDVLKMSDEEIEKIVGGSFKIVANLPYYITTPLILRFIKSNLSVQSLTLTVQKEVAERLVSSEAGENYGSITVAVNSAADTVITRIIDKTNFYPIPKVDSAVIKIDINKNKYDISDRDFFEKVVRCAFAMRRKTLLNNLSSGFSLSKEEGREILLNLNLKPDIRGEALSIDNFIALSNILHSR